jgi:hypothetical protein
VETEGGGRNQRRTAAAAGSVGVQATTLEWTSGAQKNSLDAARRREAPEDVGLLRSRPWTTNCAEQRKNRTTAGSWGLHGWWCSGELLATGTIRGAAASCPGASDDDPLLRGCSNATIQANSGALLGGFAGGTVRREQRRRARGVAIGVCGGALWVLFLGRVARGWLGAQAEDGRRRRNARVSYGAQMGFGGPSSSAELERVRSGLLRARPKPKG